MSESTPPEGGSPVSESAKNKQFRADMQRLRDLSPDGRGELASYLNGISSHADEYERTIAFAVDTGSGMTATSLPGEPAVERESTPLKILAKSGAIPGQVVAGYITSPPEGWGTTQLVRVTGLASGETAIAQGLMRIAGAAIIKKGLLPVTGEGKLVTADFTYGPAQKILVDQ